MSDYSEDDPEESASYHSDSDDARICSNSSGAAGAAASTSRASVPSESGSEWIVEATMPFYSHGIPVTDPRIIDVIRTSFQQEFVGETLKKCESCPVRPVECMLVLLDRRIFPDPATPSSFVRASVRCYISARKASADMWKAWIARATSTNVDVRRVQGGIPEHPQFEIDYRDLNQQRGRMEPLLSCGIRGSFRTLATAWAGQGSFDIQYDASLQLDKDALHAMFKKTFCGLAGLPENDQTLHPAMDFEFLTVHCNILPISLRPDVSATHTLDFRAFLRGKKKDKTALIRWMPEVRWTSMQGGLSGNSEFEDAVADTHDQNKPWIKFLEVGNLGLTNTARRNVTAQESICAVSRPLAVFGILK